MHGLLHVVYDMCRTGSLENTNTRIYENKHIEVAKEPFKAGSKRTTKMSTEMFERLEKKRLLKILVSIFEEVEGEYVGREPVLEENDRLKPWILYQTPTPNDVTYKCSTYRSNSERVRYDAVGKKILVDNLRNVNPLLNVHSMWHELEHLEGVQRFMHHFKNNHEGILTISLCISYYYYITILINILCFLVCFSCRYIRIICLNT